MLAIGCKLSNGNREGKIPLLSMPSVPPSEQFDIYSTPPIVMEYASVSPEATMEEIAPFGSVEPSLQPDQEHNLTSTTLGDEYFETVDDLLEVSPSPVSIEDVMVQGAGDMNNCAWRGSDKIVADVSKVQAAVGWTAVSRGGLNGLMFEKDGVHGVVEASEESTICFTLQAEMAGDYYTIIVSSAPHETDNNDLWIKSSKGFHLLRDGDVRREGAGIWLKGYQNEGGNALADYLLTVDHWGHAFIVQGVEKDVAFEICIAGRSSLYEVYRLVVVKCSSELCLEARPAPGSLIFNEPSVCS